MEKNDNDLLQKDAVPMGPNENRSVVRSESREVTEVNENSIGTMNNNMLLQQSNSTTVFQFDNCRDLHFGPLMNVGWSPGQNGNMVVPKTSAPSDKDIYRKTPTIKSMMDSQDKISPAFLNLLCENFGHEWKKPTILLGINQLFVERMYEDNFERGGIKEVFSKYMEDHEEKANVGWFITFLWRNGFRKTVWTVKEKYKTLRELEKDLE